MHIRKVHLMRAACSFISFKSLTLLLRFIVDFYLVFFGLCSVLFLMVVYTLHRLSSSFTKIAVSLSFYWICCVCDFHIVPHEFCSGIFRLVCFVCFVRIFYCNFLFHFQFSFFCSFFGVFVYVYFCFFQFWLLLFLWQVLLWLKYYMFVVLQFACDFTQSYTACIISCTAGAYCFRCRIFLSSFSVSQVNFICFYPIKSSG